MPYDKHEFVFMKGSLGCEQTVFGVMILQSDVIAHIMMIGSQGNKCSIELILYKGFEVRIDFKFAENI